MTSKVEIVEKNNDFVRLIKASSFAKSSQINEVQIRTQDKLLKRSCQNNLGNTNWIIAEAGMGKSYFLHELKREWQNSKKIYSYDWMFVIDLVKINFKNMTSATKFEDFLVDISPGFDKKRPWLRTALEYDKNTGRILLLLDAWDEVKPEMHENLQLFLSKTPLEVSFFIAARRSGLNLMNLSRWNSKYFALKEFDENLINKYVVKFFTNKNPGQIFRENFSNLAKEIWNWIKNLGSHFRKLLELLCSFFIYARLSWPN